MHNSGVLSSECFLINIAFKESIDMSAIHYSTLQKHVVKTFESLLGAKYADWVSRTSNFASNFFFFIFAPRSSFQSQMQLKWSHCRALGEWVANAI